ncbi:uncharacterized protein LOC143232084 [Tachypleus tridentatus]|uniref:uncharacterized protein LOC143232084 n=1 Tax=Tachypleus tridentatus TaxID=6853 RepID=UPI003FD0A4AA
MASSLVQVFVLAVILSVVYCLGENQEEIYSSSSRQNKHYTSTGYPAYHLPFVSAPYIRPNVLSVSNVYQHPSLTSRLRNFMSNLFYRRSQTYRRPFYQPFTYYPVFHSGQTDDKLVYILSSTGKQILIPQYQMRKFYKPAGERDSFQASQKSRYVTPQSSLSGGTVSRSSIYTQDGSNTSSKYGSVPYVGSGSPIHVSSGSDSLRYISDSKSHDSKVTKVSATYKTKNTQPLTSYIDSYQVSSSSFHPISSSSQNNQSPVYRLSIYERDTGE